MEVPGRPEQPPPLPRVPAHREDVVSYNVAGCVEDLAGLKESKIQGDQERKELLLNLVRFFECLAAFFESPNLTIASEVESSYRTLVDELLREEGPSYGEFRRKLVWDILEKVGITDDLFVSVVNLELNEIHSNGGIARRLRSVAHHIESSMPSDIADDVVRLRRAMGTVLQGASYG